MRDLHTKILLWCSGAWAGLFAVYGLGAFAVALILWLMSFVVRDGNVNG